MSTGTNKHHMGNILRKRLAVLGIRPVRLAEDMGICRSTVCHYLKRPYWSWPTIQRIAKATGVNTSYYVNQKSLTSE